MASANCWHNGGFANCTLRTVRTLLHFYPVFVSGFQPSLHVTIEILGNFSVLYEERCSHAERWRGNYEETCWRLFRPFKRSFTNHNKSIRCSLFKVPTLQGTHQKFGLSEPLYRRSGKNKFTWFYGLWHRGMKHYPPKKWKFCEAEIISK